MSSSLVQRLSYFPGNCALFNLESVIRLKGNNLTVVQERWDNNEDYPLVVRLIFEASGAAWTVGHWGYKEIFRSPMTMPAYINKVNSTSVHVLLQQWTRRKDDPIIRQFCFSFGCEAMVEAFVFAHNRCIIRMKEMRKSTAIAKDGIKSDTEGNSRASSSDNESSNKESVEENEESIGEEASVTSSVLSRADSFELGEETAEQLHWLTLSQNTQDPFADYHSD